MILSLQLSNAMMAVYSSVKDPGLQLQLLRHLPLSTFAQSLLRRRLALAFFFDDPKFFTKDSKSLIDLKIITRHLHKPQFSVSRQTDYAGFAALIGLLVIGLDNAEPPPIDAGREATAAFNADIDVLAERVKRLSTQILDTDAAHRKRTEAKEMVDTFHPCLLYGIRTQRQSKGMIWGDDAESEKQRSMMNGFFRKAKPVRRDLNGAE